MLRTQPTRVTSVTLGHKFRTRASKQAGLSILLSTALVLIGVLLYLWPQMRLVQLEYRHGWLHSQRVRALQRQKELQVELATLRQLSRIEAIAVQRLHMQPPQRSQLIFVYPEAPTSESGENR